MRRLVGALAVLSAISVAAGCGTVGIPDASADKSLGKQLFTEKCGSCHTLADAGSSGKIGPNLDFAFERSRKDGLGEATVRQVVRGQIAYPVVDPSTDAPGMPRDLVKGDDADAVAAYVASVAGVSSGTVPAPAPAPTTTAPTTTAPTETAGGGGGKAATADGKAVFAKAGCGGCHTMAAAGSSGSVGPNLDEAKPSEQLVLDRVTNGMGVMPSFKDSLTEAERQAVAVYVSSNAGK